MTDAPADAPSSSTAAMETDAPKSHKAKVREEQTAALPWVEKYRPKEMSDLVSHEQIIGTITKLIDAGKLPHLMLYGPPGTGKTSTILACAHKLYGKHFSSMVLELNASDDRGIDVVREQIKEFASTRQMFSSAPKLIVLDEADNMTNPAQFALRRVIEKFTRNARFCIICNYASKIIPALQSRCTRFRFAPLSKEQVCFAPAARPRGLPAAPSAAAHRPPPHRPPLTAAPSPSPPRRRRRASRWSRRPRGAASRPAASTLASRSAAATCAVASTSFSRRTWPSTRSRPTTCTSARGRRAPPTSSR